GPSAPDAHDGLRTQFDGRFRTCYPQEVVDMHFDFVLGDGPPGTRFRSENSGPVDGQRVLSFGRPDLALVNRRQVNSVEIIERRPDWTLLYQDAVAQVWGRSAVYDNPAGRRYFAPQLRNITNDEQVGSVTWPALPARRVGTRLARAGCLAPAVARRSIGDQSSGRTQVNSGFAVSGSGTIATQGQHAHPLRVRAWRPESLSFRDTGTAHRINPTLSPFAMRSLAADARIEP
ncbi:MAG: hypothetical protein KDA41_13430, partial [Planctomycetales bacterium]|nr:hypothetical protein [Planctomycetales bacterium]